MRSYLFLVALFAFIGGWLLFFHPFEVTLQSSTTPQFQIEKFVFRLLTPKGEDLWLKGHRGIKQKDILKIWGVEVKRAKERLLAKKGSYSRKMLRLKENVHYYKKDMEFECDLALYDLDRKILKVPGAFDLRTPTMRVRGRRLVYNQKVGTIKAQDIEASIKSL